MESLPKTPKEWSKMNEYNSFNSLKGLLYAPWYKAVADVQTSKGRFLPPIEASIDLVSSCNLSCQHCNAGLYLENDSFPTKYMDGGHLMDLIRFLGQWGVKATCFGGGGESTLHPRLPDAIRLSREVGMQTAVITNGTVLTDDLLHAFIKCRFVSVSIDAGSQETYSKYKGKDMFHRVLANVSDIVREVRTVGTNCDVCYKFLITEWNQHEIYDACLLAKAMGVRDFYARPADYSHQGIDPAKRKVYGYDIKAIEAQFEKCRELETEDFRVFTVCHKYHADFTPKKDFSQCYGAPVCIQICPDDNVYFCVDTRYMEFYKLGSHKKPEEIMTFWGGERHRELTLKTGKENCTSRCTYGPYCKQAEELFVKGNDPFCWAFT